MRNVDIAGLNNDLSACLTYAKAGEAIILSEQNRPVARIVPIEIDRLVGDLSNEDVQMAAPGLVTVPPRRLNPEEFAKLPISTSRGKTLTELMQEEREEGW